MTTPVNPIEYLYFGAKFRPNDVAIQSLAGEVTWGELLSIVRRIAYKLRQTGVRPNQLAVTCLRDMQPDWMVTLALMHEAVASCAAPGQIPVELEPDLVLTNTELPQVPNTKMIFLDDRWLKEIPEVPENFRPQPFASKDSLFRLILTSGTTGGRLKAAEFSLDTFLRRCERMTSPSNPYATELCTISLGSVTGFTLALRKLMRGLAFYYAKNDAKEIVRLINAYHIECLSGSPFQLTALIGELQRTSRRLSSLKTVWYVGGGASPALVANMRRELCPTVVCLYGSTEVGVVSYCLVHDVSQQPGMVGYVVPEAEAQIVNEEDQPLEMGAEGAIRLKASGMASGYYKNPEETSRSYRDGWFYPGDRGRLLNGMLVLTGRDQELINRGGIRVSPTHIDFLIQRCEGILDAATFGFENHLGCEDICAAVVVADDFKMEPFQRQLAQALPWEERPSLILKLKEIPRNQMGKPMRSQMRELHGETLRQQLKRTR